MSYVITFHARDCDKFFRQNPETYPTAGVERLEWTARTVVTNRLTGSVIALVARDNGDILGRVAGYRGRHLGTAAPTERGTSRPPSGDSE